MGDQIYGYGDWYLTAINIAFFGLFLLFIPFRKKVQRLPSSVYLAFVVALYAEMYGFPLTIYILTWFFGYQNLLTHLSGHILAPIIGEDIFFTYIHPLSNFIILAGALLIVYGWVVIHNAKKELVTSGVYSFVRHPQYLGFLLTTIGMLVQWATIPTLVMWPVLAILYYRLAKREEREMQEKFGEQYLNYKKKVPMFFPHPRIK